MAQNWFYESDYVMLHPDIYTPIFAILTYLTTVNQCLTRFFSKIYESLERSPLDEAKKSIKPLKK